MLESDCVAVYRWIDVGVYRMSIGRLTTMR
jgi:hypothetical protein